MIAQRLALRLGLACALLTAAPAAHASGLSGIVSHYGFESGRTTANGEAFNPHGPTCAHWTLPFNTILRVEYRGRSVECRVNDRGPHPRLRRALDLSAGKARELGMMGIAHCNITLVRLGDGATRHRARRRHR